MDVNNGFNDVQYVDIVVDVELGAYENRVGFSMSGGQDHLPTVINNVLEGKPNGKRHSLQN